ncbi:hypothetical protein IZU87_15595 [Cobetia sp. MC34]|nr:hypothetical protein [Cobetia sp. MC34]
MTYPEGLPSPLRADYQLQLTSPLQRTTMDSGRSRQRRRFSNVPNVASFAWLFTSPEAMLFEGWFRDDLLDGAEWFECPLRTPLGMEIYNVRFVDVYSGPLLAGCSSWRYTARLEMRERTTLDPDWSSILPEFVLGAEIFDLAINKEWSDF